MTGTPDVRYDYGTSGVCFCVYRHGYGERAHEIMVECN